MFWKVDGEYGLCVCTEFKREWLFSLKYLYYNQVFNGVETLSS